MQPRSSYIGRFAPSPSGPLHAGSLLTALASFLDARANGGLWLLRIEDIDPERSAERWIAHQQETLRHFGLLWDDQAIIQSRQRPLHEDALDQLRQQGMLYGCLCSRSTLQGQKIYTGHCRHLGLPLDDAHHWRIAMPKVSISCEDRVQPAYSAAVHKDFGDIILRRRGGVMTYHLAVTVDDAAQGITHIVRGADLWPETPLQCLLQKLLDLPQPRYLHIPVLTDHLGRKLSKQNRAPAVGQDCPAAPLLCTLLSALGIKIEPQWQHQPVQVILKHALDRWDPHNIPRSTSLHLPLHESEGFC